MEIVSEERQRARYLRGLDDAAQEFTLDEEDADALGISASERMTKRELGLRTMAKTWSSQIEECREQSNYEDAMDEATEEFHLDDLEGPTTIYEQGVRKSSQADWINAIVNRGIDKYRTAMSPEFAYAHYRGAAPQIADWLENITMPTRHRTNTFSAEAQVEHNIGRVRAVDLGMHAQAVGNDVPAAGSGFPVPVAAPAPEAMAADYEVAFDELDGVQEYANVFDPEERVQPPPNWRDATLEKADAYADIGTNLTLLSRNWYNRTSAIAEEDFLADAISDRATSNYQSAISGPGQDIVADKYMDSFAPYRTALMELPLDEVAPRGARGSDANMTRVAHVAGVMLNTKYLGFHLTSEEFTPYGAGMFEEWGDYMSDIIGAWGL